MALHGCSQNADNFAVGTHFNALADTYNFLVLYPQQTSAANLNRCWNWFLPENQERGRGEPALLAALVDDIISRYSVDPNRISITGLSAFRYINRSGRTQFRLRFTLVSASRYGTDYTGFDGGHMTNALENRPSLVIVYHTQAI